MVGTEKRLFSKNNQKFTESLADLLFFPLLLGH